MGLLSQGSPLSWEETRRHAEHVRRHGILQFLHIYRALRDRHKDVLKWGDEVEYMLVKFDHENKKVRLVLCGEEVLQTLQDKGEKVNPNHPTLWRPEYGSYMIEGTPGQPYGGTMSEFNTVQDNMRKRRQEAASVLKENEAVCTVTSFPRLGCPGFTLPEYKPTPVEGGASKSLFFPDEAINKHPRFSTLTRNIRHRRGEKVVINVPIFKDKNTPSPFIEKFPNDDGEAAKAAKPDYIYMDAMGFGMGNCCLQLNALMKGFHELVKTCLIKDLLLEFQHFSSVKDHLSLWCSSRHDQRTLWEEKLSCLGGMCGIFFSYSFWIFFPSSPLIEQQKQGVARSHWSIF